MSKLFKSSLLSWVILFVAGCASAEEVAQAQFSGLEGIPQADQEIVIQAEDSSADEDISSSGSLSTNFSLYSEYPVFLHSNGDSWDNYSVTPGAIVFHEGVFHMFYNGRTTNSNNRIGYAISMDGYEWHRVLDEPIITNEDISYFSGQIGVSSVVVEPDGTWVLYFSTFSRFGSATAEGIGRATASDPTGPWVVDSGPVLTKGSNGSWDDQQVEDPEVILTDAGYFMFFTGVVSRNQASIGLATSSDGSTWTKYNDPNTDGKFAQSDPILSIDDFSSWDNGHLRAPTVLLVQDIWVMIYYGFGDGDQFRTNPMMGYATSEDGFNWTKFEGNPFMELDVSLPGIDRLVTEWIYNDGSYFVFYSNSLDMLAVDVYVTVSDK